MSKYVTVEEEMYDCGVCGLSCAERELKEMEHGESIFTCPRCEKTAIVVLGPDHPLCVEERKARITGEVPHDLLASWQEEEQEAVNAKETMANLMKAGLQYERHYGVGE